jgi:hypothetical protein
MSTEEKLADEKVTQSRLEGERVGASSGASSFAEIEARVLEINAEIERSKQRQIGLEESLKKEAERKAEAEKKAADRAADFNEGTDLMAARLSGDKAAEEAILRAQDLEKGQEATGNFDDAARFAATAAALRQMQGQTEASDFGASSLQRIGGATTEGFRTAAKDPTEQQKKTNNILSDILKEFKDKETLVLKNS